MLHSLRRYPCLQLVIECVAVASYFVLLIKSSSSIGALAFSAAYVSNTAISRSSNPKSVIRTTPKVGSSCSHPTTTVLNMASSGPMLCRPIGIGSAVPTTRITNFDLEQVVETTDEWIQTRTGIGSRRVLVDHTHHHHHHESSESEPSSVGMVASESLRDLSVRASRAAIEMAGIAASDIDIVIVCTSTPDDLFGDAPSIASTLGCTSNTVAFDLTAACSGFLFGIVTAGQFLSASSAQTALVVGADALSRWVDWEDRNSCILFGDGAGAMVLQATTSSSDKNTPDSSPGVLGYAAHSNGLGYCDLQLGYVLFRGLRFFFLAFSNSLFEIHSIGTLVVHEKFRHQDMVRC
jgi:3-oxoacyl-[acyl-carrier-protein] synthase III